MKIDTAARLWIIPAERMKGKKEHRVPLTDRRLAILKDVKRLTTPPKAPDANGAQEDIQPEGIVFKAPRGGALSDMALTMYLRRNGLGDVTTFAVVHPYRNQAARLDTC